MPYFSSLDLTVWACTLSFALMILAYGAVVRTAFVDHYQGGIPLGWYSLLGLKYVYLGMMVAVLTAAVLGNSFLAAVSFFAFQTYIVRKADWRLAYADFWRQKWDILLFLVFCLFLSAPMLHFAAPVSSDDGTAHYSIIRKLYDSHRYFLASTHFLHNLPGAKTPFYFYPFLNHCLIARLYNIYALFGVSLPIFIAASIATLIALALAGFSAFVEPYRGKHSAVSLLVIFILACAFDGMWETAYWCGGGLRGFSCCFVFLLGILLLKDAKSQSPALRWEFPLLIVTAFFLHTQAFILLSVFLGYIFLTVPSARKLMIVAVPVALVAIVWLLKRHYSILGNLTRDSERIFGLITSKEIQDGEAKALYLYLFSNATHLVQVFSDRTRSIDFSFLSVFDGPNQTLGPVFFALAAWHLVKKKTFSVPITAFFWGFVLLFAGFTALLTFTPPEFLPRILVPFTGSNARLVELMTPFVFIVLVTCAAEYLPPALLALFLLCNAGYAFVNICRIEKAAQDYATLTYTEYQAARQVLPKGRILVIPGDRRYEVLGGLRPGYVAETAYFDCPMPGDFQFATCHRAINHEIALKKCLFNDSLLTEVKNDYPDYTPYFITSVPWGNTPECQAMVAHYLEKVLNTDTMLIYKIKETSNP